MLFDVLLVNLFVIGLCWFVWVCTIGYMMRLVCGCWDGLVCLFGVLVLSDY